MQKSETFYLIKRNNKYIYYKKLILTMINMKTSEEINLEFKLNNKLDNSITTPEPLSKKFYLSLFYLF